MLVQSYLWRPRSEETDSAEWLSFYSPIFTSSEPALTGPSGAHRIWASRRFVVSHATCNRATLIHEPSSSLGLDHLGICLVLRGSMGLQANGAHVLAGPGDIALIDLRRPFRLIFGVEGLTSENTCSVPARAYRSISATDQRFTAFWRRQSLQVSPSRQRPFGLC